MPERVYVDDLTGTLVVSAPSRDETVVVTCSVDDAATALLASPEGRRAVAAAYGRSG